MKKRILMIIMLIAILVLVLAGCSAPTANRDKEPLVTDLGSFALLEEFVTLHPDRTSGDDTTLDSERLYNNADRAGMYIAQKFIEMGYTSQNGGMVQFKYDNPFYNGRLETAYNIIFTKDNPNSDKRVIITANYDNTYNMSVDGEIVGGKGVYKNATGVVALLQTAKQLKDMDLPYDVVFAAVGAGEIGHAGSISLLKGMAQEEKDNTLLAINYDGVSGGDYLYMYADEVHSEHYDYFYNTAVDKSYAIADIPKNKRQVINARVSGSILMHYNMAMLGDNMEFVIQGINSISYLSLNFSDRSAMATKEIAGLENIRHTQADTLDNMIERMGGEDKGKLAIASDIDTATLNTIAALTKEDFVAVMESSKANRMDYSTFGNYEIMNYIGIGIIGGVIVLLVALYFAFKSKLTPHDIIIDTVYGRINMSRGGVRMDGMPGGTQTPTQTPIDPFGEDYSTKPQEPQSENKPTAEAPKKDVNDKDIFGDF